MRKIFIILSLIISMSCSKEEINYLTSLEKAKEGIIGTWKTEPDDGSLFVFDNDYLKLMSNNIEYGSYRYYVHYDNDIDKYKIRCDFFVFIPIGGSIINELNEKYLVFGGIRFIRINK